MSFFFNPLEGEQLRENSERGVYELFSSRYNIRSVRRITNDKYHVWLRDGRCMTVETYPHTTMFGRPITTVKYVSE